VAYIYIYIWIYCSVKALAGCFLYVKKLFFKCCNLVLEFLTNIYIVWSLYEAICWLVSLLTFHSWKLTTLNVIWAALSPLWAYKDAKECAKPGEIFYKSCCNIFLDERKLHRTKYQYKIPPETAACYTQGKGDQIHPTNPLQHTTNSTHTNTSPKTSLARQQQETAQKRV
jgi:hypothetical protein